MTGGAPAGAATEPLPGEAQSVGQVLRDRRFLSLWLAQVASQVGGNMVLYGLTVLVALRTSSASAVSLLLLTFLVPAVVFSAIAGVFVDRLDRRLILIVANLLRGLIFVAMVVLDANLVLIYLLNIAVSTITTLFAPAEASMIPVLVRREQLLAANGLFTFTLQGSFALGFALLGPFVVILADVNGLIVLVAACYFVAAALCATLPASAPAGRPGSLASGRALGEAEAALAGTVRQLAEGLRYIRDHRGIFWSLSYLAITASLVGVLGALGPKYAQQSLGLKPQDFFIVVLPLGGGLVLGILLLNAYGRLAPRRRLIEGGLLVLGIALGLLSVAAPLSSFLRSRVDTNGAVALEPFVSLLGIIVAIALTAGVAYAFVAVPAQTQLQEELPEDVRGRVFGVLNMLVSVASFVPIIIAGPLADTIGTTQVIFLMAALVVATGVRAVFLRWPAPATPPGETRLAGPIDPLTVSAMALGPVGDPPAPQSDAPADAGSPR
ncbi:MAG TPA: MFS transporter [Candidatus Sulfotelmatobacter sp.]|nr:MFS transporter [Candidatus Sulfotelmatobacter sp.]